MEEWTLYGIDRVFAAVGRDPFYQELLAKSAALEGDFLAVKDKLSAENVDLLDAYIANIEDLDYRMTQLAYYRSEASRFE